MADDDAVVAPDIAASPLAVSLARSAASLAWAKVLAIFGRSLAHLQLINSQ